MFSRPVCANEHLYLSGKTFLGDIVIQMVICGKGSLIVEQVEQAVIETSRQVPGSRLRLNQKTWIGDAPPPRVVHLAQHPVDGVNGSEPVCRFDHFDPVVGYTCDVGLYQSGDECCLVFRALHAVMDGQGLVTWAQSVMSILQGKSLGLNDASTTDDQFLKASKAPIRHAEPIVPACRGPKPSKLNGSIASNINRFHFATRTLNGSTPAIVAKLMLATKQLLCSSAEDRARVMIPVDLRRHFSSLGIQNMANLSLPIFMNPTQHQHWSECNKDLLGQIEAQVFVAKGRNDLMYRYLPHNWLGALLNGLWRYQLKAGRYLLSAVISHIGRHSVNDFSAPGFDPNRVLFIPCVTPIAPFSIAISETSQSTELCLIKNSLLWGSAEQVLDQLLQHAGLSVTHKSSEEPSLEDRSLAQAKPTEEIEAMANETTTKEPVENEPSAQQRLSDCIDDNSRYLHLSRLIPDWKRVALHTGTTSEKFLPLQTSGDANGPLAEVHGSALPPLPKNASTLGQVIELTAAKFAHHSVCYLDHSGEAWSEYYRDLYQRAARIGAGLVAQGIQPATPVLLQLRRNKDFVGAFWGCIAAGAIPVPMAVPQHDNAASDTLLIDVMQLLNTQFILTDQKSAPKLRQGCEGSPVSQFNVLVLDESYVGKAEYVNQIGNASHNEFVWHSANPDDTALMMLTSGTTGTSKVVPLTHRNLIARTVGEQIALDLSCADITLNWMPFDHVAALACFHIRDVFLGCNQIHAPTQAVIEDPLRWIDWLDHYQVTFSFAPNFTYALVNEQAAVMQQRQWNLQPVRYLMNGGEAVVRHTADQFVALLAPHGLSLSVMLPAWGMSETSSATILSQCFHQNRQRTEILADVGAPLPGFSIRVADEQGAVVREGQIGQLEVQGAALFSGYYNDESANRTAFTRDRWFRTGDLARLRAGQVSITGRVKDVIIVRGVNYSCDQIEQLLDEMAGIAATYTAACGVRLNQADTDQLALFFHATVQGDARIVLFKRIKKRVSEAIGIQPHYLIPLNQDDFPRTAIGKIQRAKLKQRFEAGDYELRLRDVEQQMGGENTVPAWFHRPMWVTQNDVNQHKSNVGEQIILFSAGALGISVQQALSMQEVDVITVVPGPQLQRLDAVTYQMDPTAAEQYRTVLARIAELAAEHKNQRRSILFLWPYDLGCHADAEWFDGAFSTMCCQDLVLLLLQAIIQDGHHDNLWHLLVAVKTLFSVADERPHRMADRGLPALLRTASRELPSLVSKTIDLPGVSWDQDSNALMKELLARSSEPEVVYRNEQRYVQRYQRVLPERFASMPGPLKVRGRYLIAGGLGGIGRRVAKYLLETYQASLLLVGRQIESGSDQAEIMAELKQQHPGEVVYRSVDICDQTALVSVVKEIENNWSGMLDGVIHLAGGFAQRTVIEETLESVAEAGSARTKGSDNLAQLVMDRPTACFISFLSVNAYFCGYGTAAYSAANAYVDGVTEDLWQTHGIDAYSFAWSLWDEVGMSRGYVLKEAVAKSGFYVMDPDKAIASFAVALHMGQRRLVIGMDDHHPSKKTLMLSKTGSIINGDPESHDPEQINSLDIHPNDPNSMENPWGMELTAAGYDPKNKNAVASIWRSTLSITDVKPTDNIFELGADSLTMVKVHRAIEQSVGIELDLSVIYDYPTIALLTEFIINKTGTTETKNETDTSTEIDQDEMNNDV